MVGRGLGAWCDTWSMRHPRPKANFKRVWRGVASSASIAIFIFLCTAIVTDHGRAYKVVKTMGYRL
ncbi:hypothetical protein Hanom_Chr03g00227511 [Helianthus anomalus]